MANRLITWAMGVHIGDPIAKALFVRFADGAREDGSVWPSHATLSKDTEIPRRTLQRKIQKLTDLGVIRVEARNRVRAGGRTSNKYWLLAPAEYLRCEDGDDVERCATVAQRAAPELDAGAAPQVAQPYEPLLDPTEDSDESSDARAEVENQVDELTTLWPAKTEIVRAKVREALEDAVYADGPFARIKGAVVAYLRATGGQPKTWLHKFLGHGEERHRDRAYLAWLPKAALPEHTSPAPPSLFPDEEVREIACKRWGEDWVRSWLDCCGWDAATRTINPPRDLVRSRLRDLWHELRALGVTVGGPIGSGS